jgi:hypothetical protein
MHLALLAPNDTEEPSRMGAALLRHPFRTFRREVFGNQGSGGAARPAERISIESLARFCAIARVMWEADEAWRTHLRGKTLADLAAALAEDIHPTLYKATFAWVTART